MSRRLNNFSELYELTYGSKITDEVIDDACEKWERIVDLGSDTTNTIIETEGSQAKPSEFSDASFMLLTVQRERIKEICTSNNLLKLIFLMPAFDKFATFSMILTLNNNNVKQTLLEILEIKG